MAAEKPLSMTGPGSAPLVAWAHPPGGWEGGGWPNEHDPRNWDKHSGGARPVLYQQPTAGGVNATSVDPGTAHRARCRRGAEPRHLNTMAKGQNPGRARPATASL